MKQQMTSEIFIIRNSLKLPSSKESNRNSETQLVNFLKIYFDFTYFLGMSPFRFGKDANGDYVIRKWWFQQVVCGTLHIFCALRLITEVRLGLRDLYLHVNPSAVQYFETVMNLLSLVYKTTTMKRFWKNQKEYLRILQLSQTFADANITQSKLVKPLLIRGIFGILAFQCFANLLVGKNFLVNASDWTPKLWLERIIDLSKYSFFLQDNMPKDDHHSASAAMSVAHGDNEDIDNGTKKIFPEDGILAFFTALGLLQRYTQGFFADGCIFACATTLWLHANTFSKSVAVTDDHIRFPKLFPKVAETQRMEENWDKIYSNFRLLQTLSATMNAAVGSQVTWYIAESLIYYSLNLNAVITIKNFMRKIDMIYFYILNVGTFIIAGDICSQVELIKSWIYYGKNRYKVPNEELNLVLHETLAKDIGIRGSNVFTVTYQFLGAILSTIVTIFIISVQSDDRGGTDDSYLTFSDEHQHVASS